MGHDKVQPSEERYKAAHEYMDLVYQLLEKSWEDGAVKWQAEPEMAYDPSKIHKIDFDGNSTGTSNRFADSSISEIRDLKSNSCSWAFRDRLADAGVLCVRCHAYHQTHPSPQRTPVIFQAGASKSGIEFAGKHGEAIYTDIPTMPAMAEYIKNVRASAASFGRDPYDVKIFVAMMPFLGKTVEEAQAKYDKAQSLISVQSNLAKISGFTGVDLSKFPLKEPFKFAGPDSKDGAIMGTIQNMTLLSGESTEPVTPETFAKTFKWPYPIGTSDMVADVFQEWMEKTDCDGFNLVCEYPSLSSPPNSTSGVS